MKGRRYLTEGRLEVLGVHDDGRRIPILAVCRGDSAEEYTLGFDAQSGEGEWRCTCPARRRCAHLVALQLVTKRPMDGATTTEGGST